MYIQRTMEIIAKSLVKSFPVLTVTGPRQSGKTTLVRQCFADLPYANLEDPQQRSFADSDPIGFLGQFPEGAIIDEIQHLPDLLSHIQLIVDDNPQNGPFVLTGSEQFSLRSSISQSLAGRTAILHLLPLSMAELGKHMTLPGAEDLVYKGFYPRIHSMEIEPGYAHSAYLESYLERDVRRMGEIRLLSRFQQFLSLCAGRVGQLLNLNSMANDLGVAASTLRSWLAVLEASYVVFLLKPWHSNIRKRLVKSPKLYFHDVGLASFLLGIEHSSQLVTHPLFGSLFENLCISEALKFRFNQGLGNNLCFYRDSRGNEVDLLMTSASAPLLIEIKSARTMTSNFIKGFEAFQQATDIKSLKKIILYRGKDQRGAFGTHAMNFANMTESLS